MAKYRKKPVVIEAVQWKGERGRDDNPYAFDDVPEWLLEAIKLGKIIAEYRAEMFDDAVRDHWILGIHTLEGVMWAGPDDWIIRGIKGELYPCKPDIFEATYDKVEE